jgi:hypothetical protein
MSYKRRKPARTAKHYGKAIAHASKERRSGTVRALVIETPAGKEIKGELRQNVAPCARLYTDEAALYGPRRGDTRYLYQHRSVNHYGWFGYMEGTVHVNGCENCGSVSA